jgi:sugar phosphate isomerase/epimerase
VVADSRQRTEIRLPEALRGDLRERSRLHTLVQLARAVGTSTILLPCGRQGTDPRTELSADIERVAGALTAAADIVNAAGLELLVEAPPFPAALREP